MSFHNVRSFTVQLNKIKFSKFPENPAGNFWDDGFPGITGSGLETNSQMVDSGLYKFVEL